MKITSQSTKPERRAGQACPRRLWLACLLLALAPGLALAQADTARLVPYSASYRFHDGLYLDFGQVRQNSPVSKLRVLSNLPPDDPAYFEELTRRELVTFYDNLGMQQQAKPEDLWGYAENGRLHIRWNDSFNRVSYMGSLCHFVANKVIYQNNPYDPYATYYGVNHFNTMPQTTVEMRQYILDFSSGEVYDFAVDAVKLCLMPDQELFDEFSHLGKRKQKQMMFYYLRRYNERNPLALPAQ